MTNRREFLVLLGTGIVAGCATGDGRVGVPVNVTLPPEVTQVISDGQAIINQGKKFLTDPTVKDVIKEAEGYVETLKTSKEGNFKTVVGSLAPVLGTIGAWLPPPYNVAAGVLVAVAKAYVEQPTTARLAMSPEAARRVMQNSATVLIP